MTRLCSVEGCSKPHRARGLCSTHYNQQATDSGKPRHRVVTVCCATCGQSVAKAADPRRTVRFCSLLCRDLWRIAQAPDGDCMAATRGAPRAPRRHTPAPAQPPVLNHCHVCAAPITGARRYCSVPCQRQADHTRRSKGRRERRAIRRQLVFERDGYVCWMCEQPCAPDARVPAPNAPTVDHLVPQAHGGTHEPDNLATACFTCNTKRGASWNLPRHAA